ncbi:MAG: Uma2 family endonuclease [Epsilonproteobacteria bacterium]|nr:Uma2 family endonuclease [Campylobacterota bacterium]
MEAIRYEEFYTIEDYDKWEGDWELIEGRPYAMSPAATVIHQRIAFGLMKLLDEAMAEACEGCYVVGDVDYVVASDTVLRPDVVISCEEAQKRLEKAPIAVFEVISPSTGRRDETMKMEIYRQEGVRWFGLVYPASRIIKLFRLTEFGTYVKMGDYTDETVTLEDSRCALKLDFSKIWQ